MQPLLSSRIRWWQRAGTVGVAVLALTVPLTVATASATAAPLTPTVPVLAWTDCGGGFQCATAQVPLDHGDPAGATIELALIRRPATDPSARIGSLFTNPGGPGGSGVAFVRDNVAGFDPQVQARFDIIGVDPRGVGASTPVRCFADTAEQTAFFTSRSPAPITAEEERFSAAWSVELGQRCVARNPEISAHLSTADVARDLHLLMQAVGDDALNYYGLSYGTYLGATFANLFPGDVRTLVLDGVVEPADYTGTEDDGSLTFLRTDSNDGSSQTLGAFFDLCAAAGAQACPFAAGGDPEAKFAEIAERLTAAPLVLTDPEFGEVRVTYGVFTRIAVNLLYSDRTWPLLGAALEELYVGTGPGATADLTATMAQAAAAPVPAYNNALEAGPAIVCADTANPDDPAAWPGLAAAADEETPFVGGYWSYISQPCATWPVAAQDRYAGPWDATTANPALVVGTRFDPATPYANSEALVAGLPGSRLLTLEGYGHTSFGQGACVSGAVGSYLVTGELPAVGTSCTPDRQPFDPLPVTTAEQAEEFAQAPTPTPAR